MACRALHNQPHLTRPNSKAPRTAGQRTSRLPVPLSPSAERTASPPPSTLSSLPQTPAPSSQAHHLCVPTVRSLPPLSPSAPRFLLSPHNGNQSPVSAACRRAKASQGAAPEHEPRTPVGPSPPSPPQGSWARLPPVRWQCRLVLISPARPRRPFPDRRHGLCTHALPQETRGSSRAGPALIPPGQAPRRGRGARWNLASDSLRGPHWGSRCGDLARDTPPLPRNGPTPRGQGRPSPRRRHRRPLDPQARALVPEGARRPQWPGGPRSAAATRSLRCRAATEAGNSGEQLPPGTESSHPQPGEADNTGSRENWRGKRSRELRTAPCAGPRRQSGGQTALPPPKRHSDLVSPQTGLRDSPHGPSYRSGQPSLNRPHFR